MVPKHDTNLIHPRLTAIVAAGVPILKPLYKEFSTWLRSVKSRRYESRSQIESSRLFNKLQPQRIPPDSSWAQDSRLEDRTVAPELKWMNLSLTASGSWLSRWPSYFDNELSPDSKRETMPKREVCGDSVKCRQ